MVCSLREMVIALVSVCKQALALCSSPVSKGAAFLLFLSNLKSVKCSNFLNAASGPGRCKISNGGCWHENRNGITFSACMVG